MMKDKKRVVKLFAVNSRWCNTDAQAKLRAYHIHSDDFKRTTLIIIIFVVRREKEYSSTDHRKVSGCVGIFQEKKKDTKQKQSDDVSELENERTNCLHTWK